jgi:hypothetical protein
VADTKISALTALTGANVDTAADVFPIVDTSVTTTKKILVDELRIALLSNTRITNSIGGDVALNNTGSFFTGPTCAQGTSGTWFASGTVTVQDTAGAATFIAKLWDGTTVIAESVASVHSATFTTSISLSGFLASPAGNIRISVQDSTSTSGFITASAGNTKASTLSVIRIG